MEHWREGESANLGGLGVPALELLVVCGEHGALLAELVDVLEVLRDLRFEQTSLLLGVGIVAQFPFEVVVLLLDLLELLADVGHILKGEDISTLLASRGIQRRTDSVRRRSRRTASFSRWALVCSEVSPRKRLRSAFSSPSSSSMVCFALSSSYMRTFYEPRAMPLCKRTLTSWIPARARSPARSALAYLRISSLASRTSAFSRVAAS